MEIHPATAVATAPARAVRITAPCVWATAATTVVLVTWGWLLVQQAGRLWAEHQLAGVADRVDRFAGLPRTNPAEIRAKLDRELQVAGWPRSTAVLKLEPLVGAGRSRYRLAQICVATPRGACVVTSGATGWWP